MAASTTSNSVTVSYLASQLQFVAPPRGCLTSNSTWKRCLQSYMAHWDSLWYCPRCDNVFNTYTGGYAPPQYAKSLLCTFIGFAIA